LEGLHKGIWSGHKFDIVPVSALEGAVGEEDVSESAYKELHVIKKG
jgi:hypothetical protein